MTSATSILLRLAAVFAACLFATSAQEAPDGAAPAPAAAHTRPNVVVVVIDDMAWEDVFSVPMPELQALIAKGRTYESFYVDPVCSPSRYALQFGRRGSRDGIVGALTLFENSTVGTSRDRRSVADALHDSGYATALFGKWHLSTRREFPARTGPESLLDCVRDFGYEHWYAGNATNLGRGASYSHADWLRIDDGVEARSREYASLAVVDAFTRWWVADEERPRFAVVNLFAPHEPFTHPPKELIENGHAYPATDRDAYENALVAVDTLIGRIAASVDTTNTYLFLLADNGTPKNVPPPDAKSRGYKHSVWQGGINVPLVALGPSVVHGLSKHLAHVVDVPATLLELCGAPAEPSFEDSRSFAASLVGDAPPREPVVVLARQRRLGSPLLTAVIDSDGWKFVDTTTEQFLFDLSKDPFEAAPVDDPERKAALLELARTVGGPSFDKRFERMKDELEGLKGGESRPPADDVR
jgi:arylsulfatase A-like enzyme